MEANGHTEDILGTTPRTQPARNFAEMAAARKPAKEEKPKYVMENAPEKSPPFTFVESPPHTSRSILSFDSLPSNSVLVSSSKFHQEQKVWRCQTCRKIKLLAGPHLDGKETVRSDCWPCGRKRIFERTAVSNSTGPSSAAEFQTVYHDPLRMPSPSSEVVPSFSRFGTVETTEALLAKFSLELLKEFRLRLHNYVSLRLSWYKNILYVIAEDSKKSSYDSEDAVFEEMGRYAALLMSVEQHLTSTRLQYMRCLYCPSQFSFAAACCYARTFSKESGEWGCHLYGPSRDPTTPRGVMDAVVEFCGSSATATLVSEQQRLQGSQLLYRRAHWLCPSACVAGVAIQEIEREKRGGTGIDGVEVVLLSGNMRIEDLPQAAALSLSVQPFSG